MKKLLFIFIFYSVITIAQEAQKEKYPIQLSSLICNSSMEDCLNLFRKEK
jgi:hypothetical protein